MTCTCKCHEEAFPSGATCGYCDCLPEGWSVSHPDLGEPPPEAVLESHYDFVHGRQELICRVGNRGALVGYMTDYMQTTLMPDWSMEIDWHQVRAKHPELWEQK